MQNCTEGLGRMASETSELSEWPCPLCHRNIRGKLSIANHRKNLYRQAGSTRCDYDLTEDVPDVFEPGEEPGSAIRVQNAAAHIDGVVVVPMPVVPAAVVPTPVVPVAAVVTAVVVPTRPTSLIELARRPVANNVVQTLERRTSYSLVQARLRADHRPRDMTAIQSLWEQHIVQTRECASEQFWSYFLHLYTQPAVVVDSALRAAKATFMAEQKGSSAWKSFPPKMSKLMSRLPTDFWQNVTHTVSIDVSHLQLPKRVLPLTFKFIDPSFAWILAARRQDADEMHWKPVLKTDDNGAPMYGAGVQHGRLFAEACRSCPQGSYPMGISLHWDGTSAFGFSAHPIVVGVANTNSGDVRTQ